METSRNEVSFSILHQIRLITRNTRNKHHVLIRRLLLRFQCKAFPPREFWRPSAWSSSLVLDRNLFIHQSKAFPPREFWRPLAWSSSLVLDRNLFIHQSKAFPPREFWRPSAWSSSLVLDRNLFIHQKAKQSYTYNLLIMSPHCGIELGNECTPRFSNPTKSRSVNL
jgi:hypothetical protein